MESHASLEVQPKLSAWKTLSNIKHSISIDNYLKKLRGSGKSKQTVTIQHDVIGNIQQDCKKILAKFIAQGEINFAAFSQLWRDIGFTFIFCGEFENQFTHEYVEEVFGVAKALWLPPKRILQRQFKVCQIPTDPMPSLEEGLAAFYLVYALFKVQPSCKNNSTIGHIQFTILESDMKPLSEFLETIRERQLQELQAMFCTLVTEEAFKFCATFYENPRKHLPYCEALEMQTHKSKIQGLTKNTVEKLSQLFCSVSEVSSEYVRCKLRSPEGCDIEQEAEMLSSFVNFLSTLYPKGAEYASNVPRDPDTSLVFTCTETVLEEVKSSLDPVIPDHVQQMQECSAENCEQVVEKTRTSTRLRRKKSIIATNNTVNVEDLEKKLENGIPYQCLAGKCTNKETCTHCYRHVQLPAGLTRRRKPNSMRNYMDSSTSVFPIQHLMNIGDKVLISQIRKKRGLQRRSKRDRIYLAAEAATSNCGPKKAKKSFPAILKKMKQMSEPVTELERRSGYCDSRFVLGYNYRRPSTAATSLPKKEGSVRKHQRKNLTDLHALVAKVQKSSEQLSNIREIVEDRIRRHAIKAQSKNRFDVYYNKTDVVAHLQFACSCCSPYRLRDVNSGSLPKLADSTHKFHPDRIDPTFRDFEPYLQLFAALINNPESLGELTLIINERNVPLKSLHKIEDSKCVVIGQLEACVLPLDVFEDVQKPCWNWTFTGIDEPFGRLCFRKVDPTASMLKSQEKCNKDSISQKLDLPANPQITIKVLSTGEYLLPDPEQKSVESVSVPVVLPLEKGDSKETPPPVSPEMQPDSTSEMDKNKVLEDVVLMKFPDVSTRKSVLARWGLGPPTDILAKSEAIVAKSFATKQANAEENMQFIRESVLLGLEQNIWPWQVDENGTSRMQSTQPPSKRLKLAVDNGAKADSTSAYSPNQPALQVVRADYLVDVTPVYTANGTILIPYTSDDVRLNYCDNEQCCE